ncbi:MAG: hypothetical protein H6799_02020 [Candidatus Nomurabacteria bacterium]|nr:MAG: hypothetical protein H6799_02020 [Candidatus Nomurabacteria bacterium]HRV76057.1 hypothetical protein [Candidatus Saccharimonadales bacterium]
MSEISQVRVDSPESYTPQFVDELDELRRRAFIDQLPDTSEMSTHQIEAIENESILLGSDPTTDIEEFREKHHQLLSQLGEVLTSELPGLKDNLAEKVAKFIDEGRMDEIKARLLARSEETKEVIVLDDILKTGYPAKASFLSFQRQVTFSGRALTNALHAQSFGGDYRAVVIENLLSHEILHSFMTGATQLTFVSPNHQVRNGVRLDDISNPLYKEEARNKRYGRWANEALLEVLRRDITDYDEGAYTPGVMILELAEELSPGIIKVGLEAAFLDGSPGAFFGQLELLFGPNAVLDDLDEAVYQAELNGIGTFEDFVVGLLEGGVKGRAKEVLAKLKDKHALSLSDWPE